MVGLCYQMNPFLIVSQQWTGAVVSPAHPRSAQSQGRVAVPDCTCVPVVVHPQSLSGSCQELTEGFAILWGIREICGRMLNIKGQRAAPVWLPCYSQEEPKKNLGAATAAPFSSTGSSYYSRVRIAPPAPYKKTLFPHCFFPLCSTIIQREKKHQKQFCILTPLLFPI